MENLSLKMEEHVFQEAERKIVSRQLKKESKAVQEESMKVLSEFEKLQDEN